MVNSRKKKCIQYNIWEEEHRNPKMFPSVASDTPDPGVVRFWKWITNKCERAGLEICCGKGRNVFWLAENGASMTGFDFSETALAIARSRSMKAAFKNDIQFDISDATLRWPYESESYDFIVDCFGTSEISTEAGRENIRTEAERVLRPGGYYFLQIDSPELGILADWFRNHPGKNHNTLVFPNGKIESVLTEEELVSWNAKYLLKLIEVRCFIERNIEICGEKRLYKYYWIIAQKPPLTHPTPNLPQDIEVFGESGTGN